MNRTNKLKKVKKKIVKKKKESLRSAHAGMAHIILLKYHPTKQKPLKRYFEDQNQSSNILV
jgi:hypothetical protein